MKVSFRWFLLLVTAFLILTGFSASPQSARDSPMSALMIAALVGAVVSFVAEKFPQVKDWLAARPNWLVVLIFAGLFYLIPLALAFAACRSFTIPAFPATCPSTTSDVETLIANSTVAFLTSQVWHTYVNRPLGAG